MFKKIFIVVLLVTAFVFAEEGKSKMVIINPVGLTEIETQFMVGEKSSVGAGAFFWKDPANTGTFMSQTMYGGQLSYNFYSKGGLEGLWLSPMANIGAYYPGYGNSRFTFGIV